MDDYLKNWVCGCSKQLQSAECHLTTIRTAQIQLTNEPSITIETLQFIVIPGTTKRAILSPWTATAIHDAIQVHANHTVETQIVESADNIDNKKHTEQLVVAHTDQASEANQQHSQHESNPMANTYTEAGDKELVVATAHHTTKPNGQHKQPEGKPHATAAQTSTRTHTNTATKATDDNSRRTHGTNNDGGGEDPDDNKRTPERSHALDTTDNTNEDRTNSILRALTAAYIQFHNTTRTLLPRRHLRQFIRSMTTWLQAANGRINIPTTGTKLMPAKRQRREQTIAPRRSARTERAQQTQQHRQPSAQQIAASQQLMRRLQHAIQHIDAELAQTRNQPHPQPPQQRLPNVPQTPVRIYVRNKISEEAARTAAQCAASGLPDHMVDRFFATWLSELYQYGAPPRYVLREMQIHAALIRAHAAVLNPQQQQTTRQRRNNRAPPTHAATASAQRQQTTGQRHSNATPTTRAAPASTQRHRDTGRRHDNTTPEPSSEEETDQSRRDNSNQQQ